ncbi:hypothetical protein [Streptomyces anthocyanicus]|nr:hypothetical protein [Streptomyces anthocyanicus]
MWTYYGHVDAGLLRERYSSPTGLSTVTVTMEGNEPGEAGPGVVVDLSVLGHPAAYGVRTDMTRTGSAWVSSVALVPESPEAGYDDLRWRCGWEPYIFQGLPSVDPAWVLKIDRTSGALLGIVRLLDATLLPDRQPWEWRKDVYDRILWRAPVPTPPLASAEWLETARRRDTVLFYGPLDAGSDTPADWERLVCVHAYCQSPTACDHHPPRRTRSMTESIEQYAEGAARSFVELVRALQDRGIEYPGQAHSVHSYLTRCAGELRTAIELIEVSVQQLQDKGQLMSDYRGEPLDDVLQRFTESSDAAKDLAGELHGQLSTAYSAIGRVAYKEQPAEQQSSTGS